MNRAKLVRDALRQNCEVARAPAVGRFLVAVALAACSLVLVVEHSDAEEPAKLAAAPERISPAPIASPEDISRWIEELGHDAFTVRQEAAARLLSAGMPARGSLVAMVDGPDPERRAAARRLVALIDQSEFHRRLEAFAADTDGHLGLSLPGWDQFKKLVGGDPAARALFVDMQRCEGALISAMFGASKHSPSDLLESRLIKLVQWQNLGVNRTTSPAVGSTAALIFLGSLSDFEVSEQAAALTEALLQRNPFQEALRSDNRQDAVHRLAVAWLLNCPAKSEQILHNRLNTIGAIGLEEGLPLPLAILAGEAPHKRVQPATRAVAALIVGQLGGPEHIDRLEPLLLDSALSIQRPQQLPGVQNATVQVRDVALVALLQLTGQRPADYGYINAHAQPPKSFQLQSLSRDNDQQRLEAIAQWRQWRAEHKDVGKVPAAK